MSCAIGLTEWRLAESGVAALKLAATVGADGVQFDLGGPGRGEWLDSPGRIEALRAESAAGGVKLLAVAANHLNDIGLTSGAAVVRPLLERLLNAAHALEAPLVFVPSFRRSAIDGPDALARTGKALRWAANEALSRGLLLASENVLDPGEARRLAEEVDSPAFRILLDTFNPVAAGIGTEGLVGAVGEILADQVHLKDGPPDVGVTPLLGTGRGGLDSTLAALRKHRVPVRALVLENDYRDGDLTRLNADLAWSRRRAQQFITTPIEVGT